MKNTELWGEDAIKKTGKETLQQRLGAHYFPIHRLQKHTRLFFLLPVKTLRSQMAKINVFYLAGTKIPQVATNYVTNH